MTKKLNAALKLTCSAYVLRRLYDVFDNEETPHEITVRRVKKGYNEFVIRFNAGDLYYFKNILRNIKW